MKPSADTEDTGKKSGIRGVSIGRSIGRRTGRSGGIIINGWFYIGSSFAVV